MIGKELTKTQKGVFELIKSFTGQANMLAIPRVFIYYTGDIPSSLLLSQLLYWSDKTSRKDGFIYKTYAEWQMEIGLSEYEVRKAANNLKKMGILETKIHKANGNPTVHYRLMFSNFSVSFLQFLKERKLKKRRNQSSNIPETLTENTSDTTPENTPERKENNAPVLTDMSKHFIFDNIINKYCDTYHRKLRKKHPDLKMKQVDRVVQSIHGFSDTFIGVPVEDSMSIFEDMIKHHFSRTDGATDFNINHFATQGVLLNLFNKVR